MLPDRVSNPGPLTYESGALPIALRGPAKNMVSLIIISDLYRCKKDKYPKYASQFYSQSSLKLNLPDLQSNTWEV